MSQELIGRQFGNYRIDGVIGDGGMGAVYRATDMTLDRPVAMKVMHGDLAGDPAFQARFMQEARAAARLDHPSIVRIYHLGRGEDLIFIVMELVDGLSLGRYMQQLANHNQVIWLEETLSLMAQVADALGYAHQRGVVHRDIKPDNILVKRLTRPERPGDPPLRAMVSDFGLAKLIEAEGDTQSGLMMGTLPYMSPEQVMDLLVDGRSDIYSLGVVLYQLATGRLPREVRTPEEAVQAHQYGDVPLPSEVRPGIPPDVEGVILRALARRPENRYQTAEALAADLRRAAGNLTNEEAAAFAAADRDSTVVTMLTEFPTPPRKVVWDMRPLALVNEGIVRVLIRNDSPTAMQLMAAAEERTGQLHFDAQSKQLMLAAGQRGVVDFYVRGARLPLTGRRRSQPFIMRVMPLPSPGQLPEGLEGVVEIRPQIPVWLALLLLALLLSLCGLLAWALVTLNPLADLLSSLGF